MLLRRITEHVRSQNWFAVFVDFTIVVIGVFIGIQVANWNEARAERALGREYIERIQQDLLYSQRDMQTRTEYFSSIRRHALAALHALQQPDGELGEQFLIDSFIASFSLTRSLQRNTYDEMLSSGAMKTIADLEIRQRIAEYYRVAEGSDTYINSVPGYADALRRAMPYTIQHQLRAGGCNARFSTDATGAISAHVPSGCELAVDLELTATAVEQLIAAELVPDLTRALADFDLKLQIFAVWQERAQNLHDYLDGAAQEGPGGR